MHPAIHNDGKGDVKERKCDTIEGKIKHSTRLEAGIAPKDPPGKSDQDEQQGSQLEEPVSGTEPGFSRSCLGQHVMIPYQPTAISKWKPINQNQAAVCWNQEGISDDTSDTHCFHLFKMGMKSHEVVKIVAVVLLVTEAAVIVEGSS